MQWREPDTSFAKVFRAWVWKSWPDYRVVFELQVSFSLSLTDNNWILLGNASRSSQHVSNEKWVKRNWTRKSCMPSNWTTDCTLYNGWHWYWPKFLAKVQTIVMWEHRNCSKWRSGQRYLNNWSQYVFFTYKIKLISDTILDFAWFAFVFGWWGCESKISSRETHSLIGHSFNSIELKLLLLIHC